MTTVFERLGADEAFLCDDTEEAFDQYMFWNLSPCWYLEQFMKPRDVHAARAEGHTFVQDGCPMCVCDECKLTVHRGPCNG